jgi:hypothetical protein|tara:strand:- start:290 stop:433 length:144 start_codon:yes stop_codon:yes gene_type:complete
MKKFINYAFKFMVVYLVINWLADNPNAISDVRNGLNGAVNKGISTVR